MIIDYDKTISKFKHGGHEKLEASHELIMSIHAYIGYLANKYHPYLFDHYFDDIISYCHLYLLERIYQFNPQKGRFITWSRFHILTALASFYGKYIKVVTTSKCFPPNETVYIGVPDSIQLNDEYLEHDILFHTKLKDIILKKYPQRNWDLFYDYFYLSLTFRDLAKKYDYNSWQAVHCHICKVLRFLKNDPEAYKLLEDLRNES